MIKAILIDDEPLARTIVREYLQSYSQVEVVQECSNGFEGVKAVMTHQPHLLFLDIQMPKINGFEMLELMEPVPAVIFTTAFDEYAIKAFETHAVDYLLKPFSKERFDKAMEKWLAQNETQQKKGARALLGATGALPATERIVVKTGGKIKIIPLSEVHYIEGADDYVKVYTGEGGFLKNKTMSFFEHTLDGKQFVRTHRSYIINIQQITRIDPYEKEAHLAVLKCGAKLPVSKNGYGKLKVILGL